VIRRRRDDNARDLVYVHVGDGFAARSAGEAPKQRRRRLDLVGQHDLYWKAALGVKLQPPADSAEFAAANSMTAIPDDCVGLSGAGRRPLGASTK